MMKFSERQRYVPVRSALQITDVDGSLRNRLWNLICGMFFESAQSASDRGSPSDVLFRLYDEPTYGLFKNLWHNYFKEPIDRIGNSYTDALDKVRIYFMGCKWYEVYDFLEFLAESRQKPFTFAERTIHENTKDFTDRANEILKQEMSGYRFVSGRIAQITSEQEIAAIEQAISLPDSLKPVREHLNQALKLLSDRKTPDYRNSIKESISAVESLSKIISKQDKATLGPALNAVEKTTKLHSVLKEAFQKLYGYTSDAQGIRHALMDEATLDVEDAIFMLVSCSGFINYLVIKAQKAGVTI